MLFLKYKPTYKGTSRHFGFSYCLLYYYPTLYSGVAKTNWNAFLYTDFNNGFRFPPRVPFLHFDDDLFRDEKWSFFPSSSCGEGLLFNCPSYLKFLPFEKEKFFRLSYILMLGGRMWMMLFNGKIEIKRVRVNGTLSCPYFRLQKIGHRCWRHKMLSKCFF